jgi:hypothetical protein
VKIAAKSVWFDSAHLAVDLHVDLVEMPLPVGEGAHAMDALAADFASEHVADVHHHHEPDHLRGGVEVAKGAWRLGHGASLAAAG